MRDRKSSPAHTQASDDGPRLSQREQEKLYAWARHEMPWRAERGPGFRLFWTKSQRGLRWIDLVGPAAHVVVGRHAACDVVLDEDPTLSLRHLLVTTAELDGESILRVLDLNARAPFFLDDDRPRRSIVTRDAMALRLGRYLLGALPIGTGGAVEDTQDTIPEMEIDDAARLPTKLPTTPYRRAISRVMSLPALSHVGDTPSFPIYAGAAAILNQPAHRRPRLKITATRGDLGASAFLDTVQLEQGVLIGRSTRCHDAGLRDVLHFGISRVHLLLLSHGGRDDVIDLCSTQGTFAGKSRVRRLTLGSETELVLSGDDPVKIVLSRT